MRKRGYWVTAIIPASSLTASAAERKWSGFLCCNMRTDGKWISDINYVDTGKHLIPAGTPAEVVGYGRYRVKIRIENKEQAVGNDYSRDLSEETFARRYIVTDDVAARISGYPADAQAAIRNSRLVKG